MQMSAQGSILGMYIANAWPTVDAPMPSSTFLADFDHHRRKRIYGKNAWKKEATRTIPRLRVQGMSEP